MRKILVVLVLAGLLQLGALAQGVRVVGAGSLQEISGTDTMVTVVLKDRGAKDTNLRITGVFDDHFNVKSEDGDEHPYPNNLVAEVRVQGDKVNRDRFELSENRALRAEDQQVVDRALARVQELYASSDNNQELKMEAAALLSLDDNAGPDEPQQYLSNLAKSNDLQTQLEASRCLYLAGKEVDTAVIRQGLDSGSRRVRGLAIELAGLTNYEAGLASLNMALQDRATELSVPAARALARMGNREIIPGLLNMLVEGSEEKGKAAMDALVELGGEDVIEQMKLLLPKAKLTGRHRVIQVLYRLGDEEGKKLLQQTVSEAPTLAFEAAVELASNGDFQSMQFLHERMKRREDPTEPNMLNRARAAAALIEGNDPNAIAVFQELLRGDNEKVKRHVCRLIVQLNDRRLIDILQPTIENVDAGVGLAAAKAAIAFSDMEFRKRLMHLWLM